MHYCNWIQVIFFFSLRSSIPPSIPPLPDTLYNTSYIVFPLSRYLLPFFGTTHKLNIAFLGLLKRAAPLPLCQIQARVALTLFEKLDQGPENSNIDGTQEYLDILTRYEMLKLKALQNVTGNLNLDDSNDEISETPLSLEEKIAKKWYQFEEPMEQFDYRNSLVEFVDQLSSTLSYRPSHLLPFLRLLFPLPRPCRQAGLLIWI